jgi:P27 family predicted phage terminase small subunit
MPGRKPKPISRQIAEGDPSKHGKGKLREKLAAEPKAARGLPPCPAHIADPRAREAWGFWAEELASMNLDHRPDAQMLEGACVNYASAVKAGLEVARLGEVFHEPILSDEKDPETGKFKTIGVKQKKNLWVQVRDRSWMLVHRFCSEFGLSPASRTRLTIEKKDDGEDELMKILTRPRKPLPAETIQ